MYGGNLVGVHLVKMPSETRRDRPASVRMLGGYYYAARSSGACAAGMASDFSVRPISLPTATNGG